VEHTGFRRSDDASIFTSNSHSRLASIRSSGAQQSILARSPPTAFEDSFLSLSPPLCYYSLVEFRGVVYDAVATVALSTAFFLFFFLCVCVVEVDMKNRNGPPRTSPSLSGGLLPSCLPSFVFFFWGGGGATSTLLCTVPIQSGGAAGRSTSDLRRPSLSLSPSPLLCLISCHTTNVSAVLVLFRLGRCIGSGQYSTVFRICPFIFLSFQHIEYRGVFCLPAVQR
jgi:hypothetical protein